MNTGTRRRLRHTYGLGAASSVTTSVGTVLLQSAALTGPAAPFVAVAGAITQLLGQLGVGAGCGQTCIQATDFANQAEVLLKENLNTYMGLATPRAMSAQRAALANFTNVWNGLQYSCAGVSGAAGTNCIADRQQGACHFKDSQGNCWNWFIAYHDPIANDTQVYNDAAGTMSASGSTVAAMATGGTSDALVIGAVVAGAFLLMVLL